VADGSGLAGASETLSSDPRETGRRRTMESTILMESPAAATTRRWVVDAARSTIEFRVPAFWGLSTVVGRFRRFDASYCLDDERVAAIELTIAADSLDTGNKTRDSHLRSERFFDVAAHPQVRFSSNLIQELDGAVAINGHLQAAGGEVPIALQATVREVGEMLEIEGTTRVDQRELGMTYSPLGMIRAPATLHVRARLTPDHGQA
jgi:polyisoprenoid-binding protein YceI